METDAQQTLMDDRKHQPAGLRVRSWLSYDDDGNQQIPSRKQRVLAALKSDTVKLYNLRRKFKEIERDTVRLMKLSHRP